MCSIGYVVTLNNTNTIYVEHIMVSVKCIERYLFVALDKQDNCI